MNSEEFRNLILAIALSAIVLIGWNFFFAPKPHPLPTTQQPVAAGSPTGAPNVASNSAAVRRASRRRPRR